MAPEAIPTQPADDGAAAEPEEPRQALPGRPSIIGATLVMKGELTLDEDLIIEGEFLGGAISGAHRLSISPFAHVHADVRSASADIAGAVEGEFQGSDTVIVRRTARVRGAISATRLRVEDGTNLEHTVLSGRISRAEEK